MQMCAGPHVLRHLRLVAPKCFAPRFFGFRSGEKNEQWLVVLHWVFTSFSSIPRKPPTEHVLPSSKLFHGLTPFTLALFFFSVAFHDHRFSFQGSRPASVGALSGSRFLALMLLHGLCSVACRSRHAFVPTPHSQGWLPRLAP